MARKAKTKTGKKAVKIEDYVPGVMYLWLLVKFSDSRVFKIPAEMIAEHHLAMIGRERDLDMKREIMGSKQAIIHTAERYEWDDFKNRAFLHDGKIENVIAKEGEEWKIAKKYVEGEIKTQYVGRN